MDHLGGDHHDDPDTTCASWHDFKVFMNAVLFLVVRPGAPSRASAVAASFGSLRAIFYLPSTDVYDSPGSIMVAFDQAVIPGQPNRKVEVIKLLGGIHVTLAKRARIWNKVIDQP